MTVSNSAQLRQLADAASILGEIAINSDFYLEIDGHEQYGSLIKQCPWPVLSPGEPMEVTGPLGIKTWQATQVNVALQGAITIKETVAGDAEDLLNLQLANGGKFASATIYEGVPSAFHRAKRIHGVTIVAEVPDRDSENRNQPLTITGTVYFHYFGGKDDLQGNI
jgi:hypothetical protein